MVLNSIDRERPAVYSPTGPCAQVFVVVAQMPDQIGRLSVDDAEVVCDAGDSAQRVAGIRAWCIHLADDGVLCAREAGQGRHRATYTVAAAVREDRIE
jgi:hypothetical protein